MTISYTTENSGFSAHSQSTRTVRGEGKSTEFNPLPQEKRVKGRADKSAIQNIFFKHFGVPNNSGNSRSFAHSGREYLTTPSLALSALRELEKEGLLRYDEIVDLNNLARGTEYAATIAAARGQGVTRFHKPGLSLKVTLRVREDEIPFIEENYSKEILDNIEVFPEVPIEVQPLWEIAANTDAFLQDAAKSVSTSWMINRNKLRSIKKRLEISSEIVANIKVSSSDGIAAKSFVQTALDNKIHACTNDNHSVYSAEMTIKSFANESIVAFAGMDKFNKRVNTRQSSVGVILSDDPIDDIDEI